MTQQRHKPMRERLWLKAGKRCEYCGKATRLNCKPEAMDRATRDHRIPVCRGGTNDEANQLSACLRCNGLKGVLTEAEFRSWPMIEAIRFNDLVGHFGGRMLEIDAASETEPPNPP